jgi:hypothetical protein
MQYGEVDGGGRESKAMNSLAWRASGVQETKDVLRAQGMGRWRSGCVHGRYALTAGDPLIQNRLLGDRE